MVTPAEYPALIYNALYTSEPGEMVGLADVQLLDPIPAERIPILSALLGGNDVYLAYQSGLVMAAWGVDEGIDYLQQLIATRIDKTVTLEPHRIGGQDNVYDIIAEAFSIAMLSGYDQYKIVELFKQLLQLYGECYFESKLKQALLNLAAPALLPGIKQAVLLALEHKRHYQASQLLPVLASYDKAYALAQVPLFENLVQQDERVKYNLAEMQATA